LDTIKAWVEESPYSKFLGVQIEALDESSVRLRLPYQDANSNPGQVLHRGCAASMGAIAGHAITRAALGEEAGPLHTAQMQVSYLAAARGEDVFAEARLLRRGRELCFVGIEVQTTEGKPITQIMTTVRGRFAHEKVESYISQGDHGKSDPGVMGPHIEHWESRNQCRTHDGRDFEARHARA